MTLSEQPGCYMHHRKDADHSWSTVRAPVSNWTGVNGYPPQLSRLVLVADTCRHAEATELAGIAQRGTPDLVFTPRGLSNKPVKVGLSQRIPSIRSPP